MNTNSTERHCKDRLTLYKEYRLIERNETEISGTWKGAHLLFFFLAFVFGSFCTFCFHVLMYLFDEKCVLFPKLLLLKELRHSVMYDFMPSTGLIDSLPVDFVTTHWMDKSTCYLPTYVPLVSGIFGLVWTTMFLMFSSGSRTLGLQRPWRLLPPVFIFSVAMSGLCIYTSNVTTAGLQDLCSKLSEITGSTTCSYTINVVTLAFERRIRGVFQAIQLTILSAWLHTICWVLAAVVALARVILVVDFRLVCVSADLCGDIEKMLERHEKHIGTVSPEQPTNDRSTNTRAHYTNSDESLKVRFENKDFKGSNQQLHYLFKQEELMSKSDLLAEEEEKARSEIYNKYPEEYLFIVKMLYRALDTVLQSAKSASEYSSDESSSIVLGPKVSLERMTDTDRPAGRLVDSSEAELLAKVLRRKLRRKIAGLRNIYAGKTTLEASQESTFGLHPEFEKAIEMRKGKSNLKDKTSQKIKKDKSTKGITIITPKPSESAKASVQTLVPVSDSDPGALSEITPRTTEEELKDRSMTIIEKPFLQHYTKISSDVSLVEQPSTMITPIPDNAKQASYFDSTIEEQAPIVKIDDESMTVSSISKKQNSNLQIKDKEALYLQTEPTTSLTQEGLDSDINLLVEARDLEAESKETPLLTSTKQDTDFFAVEDESTTLLRFPKATQVDVSLDDYEPVSESSDSSHLKSKQRKLPNYSDTEITSTDSEHGEAKPPVRPTQHKEKQD